MPFLPNLISMPATTALTIAATDASAAAGVAADLRTFERLGMHGCAVISSVTAQPRQGELVSQPIAADIFRAQLQAVLQDYPVTALKTGVLASAAQVEIIAECLPKTAALIIDPVLATSSGLTLMDADTLSALLGQLFPRALLVTPNLPELEHIAGQLSPVEALHPEVPPTAAALLDNGPDALLIKGGHRDEVELTDHLYLRDPQNGPAAHAYPHPSQPGSYRGTGCVLSAALTAFIARQQTIGEVDLPVACGYAIDYLQRCIRHTPSTPEDEPAILRHP